MNTQQLEEIQKKYNVKSIVLNKEYYEDKQFENSFDFTYSPEEYKNLLLKIEKDYGDLKDNKNLSDLQKATIVMNRMIKNLKYNDDVLNKPYFNVDKGDNSHNMRGVLGDNKAVCDGFADAYKNIMNYIGIDCKAISGCYNEDLKNAKKNIIKKLEDNKNNISTEIQRNPQYIASELLANGTEMSNHSWNQVKLDGKWYNVDMTVVVGNFGEFQELLPCNNYPYIFTSDKAFNRTRNSFDKQEYFPYFGNPEKANESISNLKLSKTLDEIKEYEKRREIQKRTLQEKEDFRAQYRADGEYERKLNEYSKNNLNHEKDDVLKNTRSNEENERC